MIRLDLLRDWLCYRMTLYQNKIKIDSQYWLDKV